jgi:HEPN superfamily protein
MKDPELVRHVRDHAKRLDRTFDEDPNAAIEAAHALLAGEELDAANRAMLAGGILIDAGSHVKDNAAVQQGTALFRDLHARAPTAATAYNLANGIHASATLSGEPYWSPTQCRMRQEARSLYSEAAVDEGHRSRALTNLANLLRLSHRRLEAYDAYAAALEADPQNAIASSGIARLLSEIADFRLGPETLHALAARYLAQTNANDAAIVHYAGRHAVQNIRELVKQARAKPSRRRKRPRGYAGFVWEHRLALSYAMEMFNPARRFWDDLGLISISEPMDKGGASVPPVFAMWNSLKADYAAARWLAFRATEEMDETANYQDTLDYANYGVNQSVAVLAQRAAIDVLDKIAGFASEYLGLQGDAHRVYFASRWQTPSKQKNGAWEWQPAVAAEISAGNPGVLALGDLASDLTGDGYLSSHRLLRHTGTHRFVVLHDMLPHTPRPNPFIEHHRQFDFQRQRSRRSRCAERR